MLSERPDHDGTWTAQIPDRFRGDPEGFVEWADPPDKPPLVMCKGLCWQSCGAIPVTPVERARVEAAVGGPLHVRSDGTCSALNNARRCDAYKDRPLVCRSYGGAEGMTCPHGCVTTTGQYLTMTEGMAMVVRAGLVEGPPTITTRRTYDHF